MRRKNNRVPLIDFETAFPKKPIKGDSLRVVNPYTTSDVERDSTSARRIFVYGGRCIRQLSQRKKETGGRNKFGRITARSRGGGVTRRLRIIDFKRGRKDIWATVLRIEWDPNRRAFLALIQYEDGVLSYIIAPQTVGPGKRIIASVNAPILPGNALPLRNIPVNSIVHSIECQPGSGGSVSRSAGTYGKVIATDDKYATLEMPSKEFKKFPLDCWATIGRVNDGKKKLEFNKAGQKRWAGKRPHVRGTSMHKHKHPHGGEGGGLPTKSKPAKTKWGKPALNFKTRSYYKPMGLIIERRLNQSIKNKIAYSEKYRKTTKVY